MAVYVENLLSSAKLRSMAPISQSTFEDTDLINVANEEMLLKLVSDIMSVREDFFLSTKEVSLVGDLDHYAIPQRAIGNTLKAIFYVDSGGNKKILSRIDSDDLGEWVGATGEPVSFYIQGDEVVIVPKPTASVGSLLFHYYRKPNRLTATENCAKITQINTVGSYTTFTVNTDLSANLSLGEKIDFLAHSNPFLLWAEDIEITGISSTQIQVLTTDVVNDAGSIEPKVGDYICPAGYANIPMLPEEFHALLAQMVAVRLLASLGDLNKWNAAKADLIEDRKLALNTIKNRVESSPDVATGSSLGSVFGAI